MPVLVAVAVALTLTAGSITGETTDDSIISHGTEAAAQLGAPTAGASSSDRWMRHELCREWFTVELTGEMFPGVWDDEIPECATVLPPPPNFCPDGEVALAPWWVSRHLGDGVYGPWRQTGGHQCTSDILYTQVAQAWASMPIAPNTYDVQPEGGYAVAELGVNLIVDTNPRTMDVTLLGTPVTIRAVPTLYTWTNTDGTVWTSTDPGKPYADGG
ncbi:hypothetical protein LGT39_05655, partial [Demequina sp. TTPB684]|nr:hypothetical protein [Demequina sp. TTPB684]